MFEILPNTVKYFEYDKNTFNLLKKTPPSKHTSNILLTIDDRYFVTLFEATYNIYIYIYTFHSSFHANIL